MANRGPNKRGLETRRKLLAAGMAEFHARGFSATGVDVIAKTAEVPKGSFYNFFESKTTFAAEVVDLYFSVTRPSCGNASKTRARARCHGCAIISKSASDSFGASAACAVA